MTATTPARSPASPRDDGSTEPDIACGYLGRPSALAHVAAEVRYDAIYLNSFFSSLAVRTLMLRKLGRLRPVAVVLAPRGELSSGALALKRRKKRGFILLARSLGLHHGVVWQASSEAELREIAAYDGSVARVVSNIPPAIAPVTGDAITRPVKRPGQARFVFLSRVARKKNLHFALELLRRIDGEMVFDIYGPPEDAGYVNQCTRLIGALPAHVTARFRGPVPPEGVQATLASSYCAKTQSII